MTKKWLDSIEKQKRRIDLKEQRNRHTYTKSRIQTDRVNDKKIDSILHRLGAESISTM